MKEISNMLAQLLEGQKAGASGVAAKKAEFEKALNSESLNDAG